VPTGLGQARNALVVRAADVVIAIAGEFGTLSAIALALEDGQAGDRPVHLAAGEKGRRVEALIEAV
jgi:predicted Rossmann-fold nucleotide-binding protein